MPHMSVTLYTGRLEQQKIRLAEQIVNDVVSLMNCEEESVSVAIEDIRRQDWAEEVYKPDILKECENLYKKPEYNPFESEPPH
jgi:4-oxalocrotonate tautomerase